MAQPVIEIEDLTRIFKSKGKRIFRKREQDKVTSLKALDDVNLQIKEGELFGVLGPNGAGKTTLIKILCTLLLPTSGKARVCGYDVETEAESVREHINMVSGGETSGYGILTIRENLWLFSQLYGVPTKTAYERIDAMLEVVGLTNNANLKMNKASTGERQKMNICRGFVSEPQVLFLDEPTLGLDVIAVRTLRRFIRKWVEDRKDRTILLTTHYMAEAEELCNRVAIVDKGKIIACDTPNRLKAMVRKDCSLQLDISSGVPNQQALRSLPGVKMVTLSERKEDQVLQLKFVLECESAASDVISELIRQGAKISALKKSDITLEDVFVQMTGRGLASD